MSFVDRRGIECRVLRPHTPDTLPVCFGTLGLFDRQPEFLCAAGRDRGPVALGVLDQRFSEPFCERVDSVLRALAKINWLLW